MNSQEGRPSLPTSLFTATPLARSSTKTVNQEAEIATRKDEEGTSTLTATELKHPMLD